MANPLKVSEDSQILQMIEPMTVETDIRLPVVYPEIGTAYVTKESSMHLKKAVLRLATFFKRENDYDFIQFSILEKEGYTVRIFYRRKYNNKRGLYGSEIYGAACFRERNSLGGIPTKWSLQWVWLHPYFRSKGILKNSWPQLLKDFGAEFFVETPYTHTMLAFLKKHASHEQRAVFRSLGWRDLFPEI